MHSAVWGCAQASISFYFLKGISASAYTCCSELNPECRTTHKPLTTIHRIHPVLTEAPIARHRFSSRRSCALDMSPIETIAQAKMQMRSQRVTCAPRIANPLPAFDVLPITNMKATQVG